MSKINTLHDLFIEQLKDLHSAETQLIKVLPKMAKAAHDPMLKSGFEEHLEETREHVKRLEKVLGHHNEKATGKVCKAMEGLVEEGKEMISEKAPEAVKDAGLIAAAQRVEHYEIAGYGCVRTYAELLGYSECAEILQQTLDEEAATDERLTEAAKKLNVEANAEPVSSR